MSVLIVCGMEQERNLIGERDGAIVVSGLEGDALTAAVDAAIAAGCNYVLSVGTFGLLKPGLKAGLVGGGINIVDPGYDSRCDLDWAAGIQLMTGATPLTITCSTATVATAAQKAALRAATGADAVDLESCTAARIAARRGKPFAWLRAASDEANQDIPPLALAALATTGKLDIWALIDDLPADHDEIPALLALANSSNLAFNALSLALANLGVVYGIAG